MNTSLLRPSAHFSSSRPLLCSVADPISLANENRLLCARVSAITTRRERASCEIGSVVRAHEPGEAVLCGSVRLFLGNTLVVLLDVV